MDDLYENLDKVAAGLRALMVIQENYDVEMWAIQDPPFDKFRHICLHLMILTGGLAKMCEGGEHIETSTEDQNPMQLVSEKHLESAQAVADLLIHAAQLANLLKQDLYPALIRRYVGNAQNFAPNSVFATLSCGEIAAHSIDC